MAGNHGGRRVGAGRKPGAVTVLTRRRANELAAADVSPLDVMAANMSFWSNEAASLADRLLAIPLPENDPVAFKEIASVLRLLLDARQQAQRCAVDLAPYVHPKPAPIPHDIPRPQRMILQVSPADMEL